jgi:hypothetical protein
MPCDILCHLFGVRESSGARAPGPAIERRFKRHVVLIHHAIKANGISGIKAKGMQ